MVVEKKQNKMLMKLEGREVGMIFLHFLDVVLCGHTTQVLKCLFNELMNAF